MTTPRIATLALFALLLAGCASLPLPKRDGAIVGPYFTPANVKTLAKMPAEVRRIVILPVAGGPTLTEETLLTLDSVCQSELNRTGRFEVVPLTRDALAAISGLRQISSVERLPIALLDKLLNIYNTYGADAILFIDVTTYSPYPPLKLGLRTKLARVSDGEIIWAADNVFNAAEPRVANSARHHAEGLGTDRGRTDLSHTILQNPQRFAGYVAAATFVTLPPR
ncbi:MAG: hypothetical protein IPP19_13890 [Verrucomicrobia bacterium]|nr:hypothetical protein [Verrucomicrobiota bacterium]